MAVITTRILVHADGSISISERLPVGEHTAKIEVTDDVSQSKPIGSLVLPAFDVGPWPETMRLGRSDLYGDDGR